MNHTEHIIKQQNVRRFLELLEDAAGRSLTDEVDATPKPGLVDRVDSGAHKDMDYRTFEVSIKAILPYIREMAEAGIIFKSRKPDISTDEAAEQLLHVIRPAGIQAEKAMFAATGGVNTHKGIIFSMGLAAAASGLFFHSCILTDRKPGEKESGRSPVKADDILLYCGKMCRRIMENEFKCVLADKPKTHGELLYVKYGCRGIRGEAADGFPAVRNYGLPALRNFPGWTQDKSFRFLFAPCHSLPLLAGKTQNILSLHILLTLMAYVDDTNVLFRTDYPSLEYVKQSAASILKLGGGSTREGVNALTLLNTDFIERNISPGGCADLLTMTLFLWRLELIFASFDKIIT